MSGALNAILRRTKLFKALAVVWLVCVLGGALLPRSFAIFDFVENWLGDLRVATLSPRMERRKDIILLTITEDTLGQFPYRFPIDRGLLADALEHLDQAGVRAVGLDILFDQPTEPEKDRRLERAVADFPAPVIIGWADTADGMTEAQAEFLSAYLPRAVKAHANLVKGDRDGTVRWIFPGRQGAQGFRPGTAAALARAVGIEAPGSRSGCCIAEAPTDASFRFRPFRSTRCNCCPSSGLPTRSS